MLESMANPRSRRSPERRSLARRATPISLIGALSAVLSCPAPARAVEFSVDLALDRITFETQHSALAVSAGGHTIAYTVSRPDQQEDVSGWYRRSGAPAQMGDGHIYLRRNGQTTEICPAVGSNWNPVLSPNSHHLAFLSDRLGQVNLFTFDLRTGMCRRVSDAVIRPPLFGRGRFAWSLDGATIYVTVNPQPREDESDGRSEASLNAPLPFDQGSNARIYRSGSEADRLVPSAARLLYHRNAVHPVLHTAAIAAIDLNTGATRPLLAADRVPRPGPNVALSPSGRWVVNESSPSPTNTGLTAPNENWGEATLSFARADSGVADAGSVRLPYGRRSDRYLWHPSEDELVFVRGRRLFRAIPGAAGATEIALSVAQPASFDSLIGFAGATSLIARGRSSLPDGNRSEPSWLLVDIASGRIQDISPASEDWRIVDVVRTQAGRLWQPRLGEIGVRMSSPEDDRIGIGRLRLRDRRLVVDWSATGSISQIVGVENAPRAFAIYEDLNQPPDLMEFVVGHQSLIPASRIDPRFSELGIRHRRITAHAMLDGQAVDVSTNLLLPSGASPGARLPMVVIAYAGADLSSNVADYGGGASNSTPTFLYTSRGYAVLLANLRFDRVPGTGPLAARGRSMPQLLAALLRPQIAAAERTGYIDPDRVALTGTSYGGYATAAIVSQMTGFRAAVAVNGYYDLFSVYTRMLPSGHSVWAAAMETTYQLGQNPWVDIDRYVQNSPFHMAPNINTPLLLVAGGKDTAVETTESVRFFTALRSLDRPAVLALYPDAGHVIQFWAREDAADATNRILAFLQSHGLAPDRRSSRAQ